MVKYNVYQIQNSNRFRNVWKFKINLIDSYMILLIIVWVLKSFE